MSFVLYEITYKLHSIKINSNPTKDLYVLKNSPARALLVPRHKSTWKKSGNILLCKSSKHPFLLKFSFWGVSVILRADGTLLRTEKKRIYSNFVTVCIQKKQFLNRFADAELLALMRSTDRIG